MKLFNPRIKIYLFSIGVIILFFILFFVLKNNKSLPDALAKYDLKEIKKRGKLVAVVDKNSIDYYVYRGRPMGFQLDLLRRFSDFLALPLEIIVENNYANSLQLLNSGKCDILASNVNVLKEYKKKFSYTHPILRTRQVLIQRKRSKDDPKYVKTVLELARKKVHVKANSAYYNRLVSLSEEIGDTIYIKDNPYYSEEMLIKQVSSGLIDYTVVNENIAKVNAKYFANIDYSIPISLVQNTAWVIRKNSYMLENVLNKWLNTFKKEKSFEAVYHKYFESEFQGEIFRSDYYSLNGNRISDYDETIKKCSRIIGWDWRLLASLIYQESKFNNDTVSRRGAFGLMQMMPVTAEKYEVDSSSTPEENINAGVLYIKWLEKQLMHRVDNFDERVKFVLAAYNVGLGHIFDAQALAKKYGKEYQKWDNNVDFFLLNKSKPKYLNDSLVRNGSIKGKETYAMVKRVMERYHHYKNLIAE